MAIELIGCGLCFPWVEFVCSKIKESYSFQENLFCMYLEPVIKLTFIDGSSAGQGRSVNPFVLSLQL